MIPVLVPYHWKICDLVFAVWLTGHVCRPTDSGADLSDTDLRGADFSLANLTKVIKCSALHITFVQFHACARGWIQFCSKCLISYKYLILTQKVQPSFKNQTFIFGPILFMLVSLFFMKQIPSCFPPMIELSVHRFQHGDLFFNTRGWFCLTSFLQTNLSNANLEGALVTGNTSFKGANITGAGK